MKRVLAALLAASGASALAQTPTDMHCAQYDAMNAAGQMAAVDSMRSGVSAGNKMVSSHVMADKVSASCKDHRPPWSTRL